MDVIQAATVVVCAWGYAAGAALLLYFADQLRR